MVLKEIVLLAYRNIKRQEVRTFLTVMGVAVGIASVILFISIGVGIKGVVMHSFGNVGNDLMVTPKYTPNSNIKYLSSDDINKIKTIEGVEAVLPRETGFALLEYSGRKEFVSVIGVEPSMEKRYGVKMAKGRFLRDSDHYVAVLGAKETSIKNTVTQHQNETYQEQKEERSFTYSKIPARSEGVTIDILRPITLKFPTGTARRFRISGVLKEGGMSGTIFANPDDAVIIPLKTMNAIMGKNKNEFSILIVKIKSQSDVDEISREIKNNLDVNVMSLKSILGAIGSFFKVVEVVFLAIGSIALIVAGFGIMNTMLMSVLERTREIGVLKSIGAKRSHIIQIFLAESALIGLFGGILGVIFGIIGSISMNIIAKFALVSLAKMPAEKVAELPAITQIPLWLILFALCFSVIISVAFGLYPAIKASKLSPVEALRYQ